MLKLMFLIFIPFVVYLLQKKKKKTRRLMNPPPVPFYEETYCVFAIKLINTIQVFLTFMFAQICVDFGFQAIVVVTYQNSIGPGKGCITSTDVYDWLRITIWSWHMITVVFT